MDGTVRNGAGRKRESCRKVKRRAVFFELHAEHALALDSPLRRAKRPLSADEAAVLFRAIDNHQLSRFGIVKLAGVDLDAEYDVGSGAPATLLAHAVKRNAHTVTSQLLRAGANAASCLPHASAPRLSAELSSRLRLQLMSLQSCHRVLLTNIFFAFSQRHKQRMQHIRDAQQWEPGEQKRDQVKCDCGCGGSAQLLAMPCNHRLGAQCFWKRVLTCSERGSHCDVSCGCKGCGAIWDLPGEPGSPAAVPLATLEELRAAVAGAVAGAAAGAGAGTCEDVLVATLVAAQSRERWAALPASAVDDSLAVSASSRPKGKVKLRHQRKETSQYVLSDGRRNFSFRLNVATPLVSACFCLCATQSQRSQELYQAACIGYTQRVLELVSVGADVDCVNDCGVSVLSAAVFHGHVDTTRLLLQCGARADLQDRLGVTALDIAHASEDLQLVRLLSAPEMGVAVGREQPVVSYSHPGEAKWFAPGTGWLGDGRVTSLQEASGTASASAWCAADAFVIDGAFSEEYLLHLDSLFRVHLKDHVQLSCRGNSANDDDNFKCVPPSKEVSAREVFHVAEAKGKDKDKTACSDRALFADTTGAHVVRVMNEVLQYYRQQVPHAVIPCRSVLPAMRFLCYQQDGGSSPPHVDLTKTAGTRRYPYHGDRVATEAGDVKTDGAACEGATEAYIEDTEEREGAEGLPVQVPLARSSHTFILYLTTCIEGGQTALLRQVPGNACQKPSVEKTPSDEIEQNAAAKEEQDEQGEQEEQEEQGEAEETPEGAPEAAAAFDEEANTIVAVQPVRGRLLFFPHNHPHEGRPVVIPGGSSHQKLLLRGEMF